MEPFPIILVSISAIGHAYWNYKLKKTIDKTENKLLIYWLSTLIGLLLFFPIFIFYLIKNPISYSSLIYLIVFGFFLALYMLFLTKTYSYHDLSLAYPLTKIIPFFTLLLGIFILKEQVSMNAFLGIFLILLGAYSIHLKNFSFKNFINPIISLKSKGSMFALLTAIISAFYGLVSKISLEVLNPVVFVYLGFFLSFLFYSLIFFFNKELLKNIKTEFKEYKKSIITIGLLDIFGYFLVLIALIGNKLSYIFALRQMSIIFAVLLGSKVLKEKYGNTRFISSIIILIGIILIIISK